MRYKHSVLLFLLVLLVFQSCAEEVWSPQNGSILFMSNRDGNGEIYLNHGTDPTGVNLSNHDAGDNWASWSPDGEKILFQGNRSGNLDVWLMNKDRSDPIQLTANEDHDYFPTFTPDGKTISFTSRPIECIQDATKCSYIRIPINNRNGVDS